VEIVINIMEIVKTEL